MKNLIMSSKVIIMVLLGITLLFLFACTQFPQDSENERNVSVQLIWNITTPNISSPSSPQPSPLAGEGELGEEIGEGNKLSIKASYDDIVKAGVTTVVLKAEDSGNILKEKSFPVEARYGELNGLPAKNINIIAEARDGNKTLFRGAKGVDLIKNDFIQITITMNETPEYFANKATPAPPTPTPTPSSSIEMVNIPAGSFTMGSLDSDSDSISNEKPQHTVTLSAYSISKYEVTQGQYKKFMDATGHAAPTGYWNPASKGNYPVTNVDWNDAKAFCEWAGGRLPTEAEWEKAARGTDGRKYPWGNNEPDNSLLNFNNNKGGTTSVGSYPLGASPYGVMDMAGNVWEWVNDWYDGSYYSTSPSSNPQGPSNGSIRVERGGSWYGVAWFVRCAYRNDDAPSSRGEGVGFRLSR